MIIFCCVFTVFTFFLQYSTVQTSHDAMMAKHFYLAVFTSEQQET